DVLFVDDFPNDIFINFDDFDGHLDWTSSSLNMPRGYNLNFNSKYVIVYCNQNVSKLDKSRNNTSYFSRKVDCVLSSKEIHDINIDKLNCFLSTDVVKSDTFFGNGWTNSYKINRQKYEQIKRKYSDK